MIFATVGTQLPFPRLINALDSIAAKHKLEIIAQTCAPEFDARAITARPQLSPAEFDATFQKAELIVAHAGMGTVLSAKRYGKPLIVFPRLASLREHRNEHQLASVRQLASHTGIYVATDEESLTRLLLAGNLVPANNSQSESHKALIEFLRGYINSL